MQKLLPFGYILILSSLLCGQVVEATTKDGKEVLLNADGTWKAKPEEPVKVIPQLTFAPTSADDPLLVAKWVAKFQSDLDKSEFETEAEYLQRIEAFAKTTKNSVTGRALGATQFIMNWTPQYNAERQRFTFRPATTYKPSDPVLCERQNIIGWGVMASLDPEAVFSVDPAKARELKSHLQIAVIGTPMPVYEGLCLVPSRYLIFNTQTGEVYQEEIVKSGLSKPIRTVPQKRN